MNDDMVADIKDELNELEDAATDEWNRAVLEYLGANVSIDVRVADE